MSDTDQTLRERGMGVSDLKDALDNDRCKSTSDGKALIVDRHIHNILWNAARRVANPDYDAAAEIIGPVIQPAFVRMAVNAALGISEDS